MLVGPYITYFHSAASKMNDQLWFDVYSMCSTVMQGFKYVLFYKPLGKFILSVFMH